METSKVGDSFCFNEWSEQLPQPVADYLIKIGCNTLKTLKTVRCILSSDAMKKELLPVHIEMLGCLLNQLCEGAGVKRVAETRDRGFQDTPINSAYLTPSPELSPSKRVCSVSTSSLPNSVSQGKTKQIRKRKRLDGNSLLKKKNNDRLSLLTDTSNTSVDNTQSPPGFDQENLLNCLGGDFFVQHIDQNQDQNGRKRGAPRQPWKRNPKFGKAPQGHNDNFSQPQQLYSDDRNSESNQSHIEVDEMRQEEEEDLESTEDSQDSHMNANITDSSRDSPMPSTESAKFFKKIQRGKQYKQFQCEQCPKQYSSSNYLQSHISAFHVEGGNGNLICDLCKKQLSSTLTLHRHKIVCSQKWAAAFGGPVLPNALPKANSTPAASPTINTSASPFVKQEETTMTDNDSESMNGTSVKDGFPLVKEEDISVTDPVRLC